MSLDLGLDDAQQAIADAVAKLCRDCCPEGVLRSSDGRLPTELWQSLAELGVLGLGATSEEGGALEIVAAMESLGQAVFPGPLVASFFAAQLLDGEGLTELLTGRGVVSLGTPPLMPWAPHARIFIELDGTRAWLAEPTGAVESVPTLGGEPWGRLSLRRGPELEGVERALVLADVARAAYLAGAGLRLVDDAAAHAGARVQFGRPIGEFQAVAHPLADAYLRLVAARHLARVAAFELDAAAAEAPARAAAARLSAGAAALGASYVCHQVFGAVGVTLEGPVFQTTRRIRQLVSTPPDERRARALVREAFE